MYCKIMYIYILPVFNDDKRSNHFNWSRKTFKILHNKFICEVYYLIDENARWWVTDINYEPNEHMHTRHVRTRLITHTRVCRLFTCDSHICNWKFCWPRVCTATNNTNCNKMYMYWNVFVVLYSFILFYFSVEFVPHHCINLFSRDLSMDSSSRGHPPVSANRIP